MRSRDPNSMLGDFEAARGYWIHMGRTSTLLGEREELGVGGAQQGSHLVGSMVHGLLENESPRRNLLRDLAARRDLGVVTRS